MGTWYGEWLRQSPGVKLRWKARLDDRPGVSLWRLCRGRIWVGGNGRGAWGTAQWGAGVKPEEMPGGGVQVQSPQWTTLLVWREFGRAPGPFRGLPSKHCVTLLFEAVVDERPINYCASGLHDCDIPQRAQCIYTGGSSYTCSCLPGFSGDGRACQGAKLLWVFSV